MDKYTSSLISKPNIEKEAGYNRLSLRNRKIRDLDEIFIWFSDSELNTIIEFDVSYNEITSIDQAFVKLKSLTILRASNNKITSISIPRGKQTSFKEIDLSGNKLTSLSSFEGINFGHLNLASNNIQSLNNLHSLFDTLLIDWFVKELNLVGNPIADVESLKSFSLSIHKLQEYEEKNKEVKSSGNFNFIREAIRIQYYGLQRELKYLFEIINEKKVFIYLDKDIIDSTGLPQHNGNDDFDGLHYIEIETKDKIDWKTFCNYFGLKVKDDSKLGCAGVLTMLIVVTLIFFIL